MSSTTKTTADSKPPAWALPAYQQAGSEATRLYNNGSGFTPYMGSTVADLSGQTVKGINDLASAGANWNTAGSRPLFQGIGAAATSNPYESHLNELASDDRLDPASNPYYAPALTAQLSNLNNKIQSEFSGAGRYGSGANMKVLGDSLGGALTNAYNAQYNQNAANQLSALNSAGSMYATGIGQAQNAANSIAGLDQQNFENRLNGANAEMTAGQALDQQAQSQLNDKVNLYNQLENLDWTRLGALEAAASGAAGNYGQQVSASRSSNPLAVAGAGLRFLGK